MELALSLGDTPKLFSFLDKPQKMANKDAEGFCLGADKSSGGESKSESSSDKDEKRGSSDPPLQLDLLPFSPVPRTHTSSPPLSFSWLTDKLHGEMGCSSLGQEKADHSSRRPLGLGVDKISGMDDATALSSPNSSASSFQMEFSMYRSGKSSKRGVETNEMENHERGGASSRASDEEENGMARKKLRLTKDQSAFLEESFKEHSTLNPKQKQALAKQLNLRPRQVEVWFQNRRARTKLKQTEVDCEYLKRCCDKLTEENRKLQKELQELRALKSSQSLYTQLPATTLTMCPSCERVATTTTTTGTPTSAMDGGRPANMALMTIAKPIRAVPFSPPKVGASQSPL